MRCKMLVLLIPAILAGCSEYGYRYQPHPQVVYSPIFADYKVHDQAVDILVDTDGLLLKNVAIQMPDGKVVKPTRVDYPAFSPSMLTGTEYEFYGPDLADGPTVAHFDKSAVGSGPWNVKVNIQDVPAETIEVGVTQ